MIVMGFCYMLVNVRDEYHSRWLHSDPIGPQPTLVTLRNEYLSRWLHSEPIVSTCGRNRKCVLQPVVALRTDSPLVKDEYPNDRQFHLRIPTRGYCAYPNSPFSALCGMIYQSDEKNEEPHKV